VVTDNYAYKILTMDSKHRHVTTKLLRFVWNRKSTKTLLQRAIVKTDICPCFVDCSFVSSKQDTCSKIVTVPNQAICYDDKCGNGGI